MRRAIEVGSATSMCLSVPKRREHRILTADLAGTVIPRIRGHWPSGLGCPYRRDEAVLKLSHKWAQILRDQSETGMGYQICTVTLRDGRHVERVIIVGGTLTEVAGDKNIPFTDHEIVDIRVTHGK
jgi:hypothetical protein